MKQSHRRLAGVALAAVLSLVAAGATLTGPIKEMVAGAFGRTEFRIGMRRTSIQFKFL